MEFNMYAKVKSGRTITEISGKVKQCKNVNIVSFMM